MSTVKPEEYAELRVNRMKLRDWKSVQVMAAFGVAPRDFRFSVSEASDVPLSYDKLRVKPGDRVEVYLAGQLAATGYVIERQVAYDAHRHGVLLIGQGNNQDIVQSSAEGGKGGEFVNKNWKEITEDVIKPYGIKLDTRGFNEDNNRKFPRLNIHQGETVFTFIERAARARQITLGEGADGSLIAYGTGGTSSGGGDSLVEGQNILEARGSIIDLFASRDHVYVGQDGGTNQSNGKGASALSVKVTDPNFKRPRLHKGIIENPPGGLPGLKARANYELAWSQNAQMNIDITVQGWLKKSGGLWEPVGKVFVKSPMLLLNNDLFIQRVVFTQDNNGGTTTCLTVTLWNPQGQVSVGTGAGNQTQNPGQPMPGKDMGPVAQGGFDNFMQSPQAKSGPGSPTEGGTYGQPQ